MTKNLLIVLLSIISCVYIYKYYSFEAHITKMVNSAAVTVNTPHDNYTDSRGIEHTVTQDNVTTYSKQEAIKQTSFLKPYIDTLSRALNMPQERITGGSTISITTNEERVHFLEKQVDSLKHITLLAYKDKHLSLTVRPDSSNFDLAYDADLNTLHYWKPRKVLGIRIGKNYYTDVSVDDPRFTIKGNSTFTIQQPKPNTFSLQVSASYSTSNGLSFGPTVQADLHPITLRAGTYYNLQRGAWQPTIGASYTLISF